MIGKGIVSMITYYNGDIKRINHSLKVYGYAKAIAEAEGLTGEDLAIIELAAIYHDIGIPESIRIHGSAPGEYQEKIGVAVAEPLLQELLCSSEMIEKILFIIGHHHSYNVEGGIHLQIIFEADFFVNIEEGNLANQTPLNIKNKFFKTDTGRLLMEEIFKV